MRLPDVDLNLFALFDVIYAERNLSRAARQLHVTQPAVSNALRRLREAFGDPLFVRTAHGVTPTPVADAIAGPVRDALRLFESSLSQASEFDPSVSTRTFRLSVRDIDGAVLLPRLMHRLAEQAPNIAVECFAVPRRELVTELASGSLDFALDVPLFSVPQLCREQVATDRYVCMLRPGHPLAADPLDLERYLALDHVHVSGRRHGAGHVDMALERLGHTRRIKLRMKDYIAAPQVVASTDMALTAPQALAERYRLAMVELPFEVERLTQFLYWHKSADPDPANGWMRGLLMAALESS